jgi:1-hydroxycarotenoid 3,4-desaturase
MNERVDVAVVGAGIGGLSAATLLAARGLSVRVLERSLSVGGKAGVVNIGGVTVDTGPSVLTLPEVFEDIFAASGRELSEVVTLLQPQPAFVYSWDDGVRLELQPKLEATLACVAHALGAQAARELADYLAYARRIWQAAAPHFVLAEAPSLWRLLCMSFGELAELRHIDALGTLGAAIEARVKNPYLRCVLKRFATYNGSDVRRAPATLGCIAHVELGLGGYGVRGGMHALAEALLQAALRVGVRFELSTPVSRILRDGSRITGVLRESGAPLLADQVVVNADVGALRRGLLPGFTLGGRSANLPSMSAYSANVKARRRARPAHQVLFPRDYDAEFADIFDSGRVPREPAVYLCAQEVAHARAGWREHEPLFIMINAPAVSASSGVESSERVRRRLLARLCNAGLIDARDELVWWRTPEQLAAQFPGSDGALYGAASNGPMAAFERPANRVLGARGLFLASGSAHPGGGIPLVAQSGKQAARLVLRERGLDGP